MRSILLSESRITTEVVQPDVLIAVAFCVINREVDTGNREVDTGTRDEIIERMPIPRKVWHFVEQRKY